MDKLKLRIKASDYELEAEGSRDFLNEQYEAFKQLLEDVAQKPVVSKSREKDNFSSSRAIAGASPARRQNRCSSGRSPVKSFQKLLVWDDRSQRVTSTVLPDGPTRIADTVLLLLLGYRELRGLNQVPALAAESGTQIRRLRRLTGLDREMAPYLKATGWFCVPESGKAAGIDSPRAELKKRKNSSKPWPRFFPTPCPDLPGNDPRRRPLMYVDMSRRRHEKAGQRRLSKISATFGIILPPIVLK